MIRVITCAAVLLSTSVAAAAAAVVNSTGGTNASNGLRVTVGGSGQIQIRRNGADQFYTDGTPPGDTTNVQIDNGIYLGIGALNQASPAGVLVGPMHVNFSGAANPAGMVDVEWTGAASGGSTGSGTATFSGSYAGTGGTYSISAVYDYTVPDDHVTLTWTLVAPAGNTAPLTIYLAYDAMLGGVDSGPSFHSTTLGETAGVYNATTVEAIRFLSGSAWTHYYAGLNNCMFSPWTVGVDCTPPPMFTMSMQRLRDFPDFADASTQDNGFGVQWSLGTIAATTRSATTELFFRSRTPVITKAFAPTTIASDATATLVFTIENEPALGAHGSLSFTDTFRASPLQLRVANPPNTSNTCGGTLQDSSGGTLAAGDTGIRLSGGSIAASVATCTISVDVTATNVSGSSQTLLNGAPDVTVTNLADGVSLQSLVVTTRPPPTITSVTSSTANGTYGIGATIDLAVNVSAAVPAGQSLSLTLSSGAVVNATCGAPGPCTALSASYVVANGDATPLLVVTSVSGTLTDTVGATNNAPSVPGGSNLSATKTIVIDGIAPAAPVLTAPSGVVTSTTVNISGTAEAAAIVTVLEGAMTLCTPTSSGTFTCPSLVFGEGMHTLTAIATDAAGNASPTSAGLTFTVDLPPQITSVTSSAASGLYGIADAIALIVNLSKPVPGGATLTLTLSSGAMVVASCSAGPCTSLSGSYVVASGESTPSLDVTAVSGSLSSVLGTTNAAPSVPGGSNLSATKTIVIDGVAPAPPVITAPVGTVMSTIVDVSGTSEASTSVTVYEGATLLCTTSSTGSFGCAGLVFSEGAHTLHAVATDAAGNASAASADYTFTVDVPATPPQITSVTSTTPNGAYTLGDAIAIDVNLSQAAPPGEQLTLTLSSGAVVIATCAGPSACAALHVVYVVGANEETPLLSVTSVSGSIMDTVGNANVAPTIAPGTNLSDSSAIAIVLPFIDTDGDGLSDAVEATLGTNPLDRDTDDDGLADGAEPSYATDADSDDDGLLDGVELSVTMPVADPDGSGPLLGTEGAFVPDADPTTQTDPRDADSDDGGVSDGAEDANHNGAVDGTEIDPNSGTDDLRRLDLDGDGIFDLVGASGGGFGCSSSGGNGAWLAVLLLLSCRRRRRR